MVIHQPKTFRLTLMLALLLAIPAKLLASDDFTAVGRVLANPYAHHGAKIKFFGILGRYIAPQKALFSIGMMNMRPIVLLTNRNLAATQAMQGSIWCVATVQGTDVIETINGDLEVLLVEEQSCEADEFEWMRKEEILEADEVVLSNRHQALSVKDHIRAAMLTINPYALIGRKLFIAGTYRRNIDEHSAVVDVWHPYPGNLRGLFMNYTSIKMDTQRDLSTTWKAQSGVRAVKCVVEILGVERTRPNGPFVPHAKEIECLTQDPKLFYNNTPTTLPATPVQSPLSPTKPKASAAETDYLLQVEDIIRRQWIVSPLSATNKVVTLTFEISKSGEISNLQTKESSGDEQIDAAARLSVQAVNPLPTFPPELAKEALKISYKF